MIQCWAAQEFPPRHGKRALILSDGSRPDARAAGEFLRRLLEDLGAFDVRLCDTPIAISKETLAGFDVLVDDYAGPRRSKAAGEVIESFVRSGKGLVLVHDALANPGGASARANLRRQDWTGFSEMTQVDVVTAPPHDPQARSEHLLIEPTSVRHPVTQGGQPSFTTADLLPTGLHLRSGAQVLATVYHRQPNGQISRPPAVFVSTFGQGRVFCTALGHGVAAMQESGFITAFVRGTEWAATGNVRATGDLDLPGPQANAVRALLVVGGHEHETTFYSLFSGWDDLAPTQVSFSGMAFKADLRKKFDVIVMYDFARDLDDEGKANLRAFMEARKGVVVLHHAILSYQKWPWWYHDVVGGRYRLDADPDAPASSARDGRELFVTPVGAHPITDGLGPFHLWDEPYKGMWISPDIRPLLTTDSPDSDPWVAWLGPNPEWKVVFIQLGHGRIAFRHPSYRALVHNAILWAASRARAAQ